LSSCWERLCASFRAPFSIRGADVYASASIGVSVADGSRGGLDAEGMIREADTAMYQAKEAGRDGIAAFDSSMRDRASRRLQLEHHLRSALANHELQVLLQPIVRLDRGGVDGFEALLRWRHRTLGDVAPAEFIPIAEDSGLINEIGAWTIDEACRSLRRCRQLVPGAPDLTVAVNLSARQLRDPGLVPTVERALERHGLPPSALCLELTESLLMEDPLAAAETLWSLRRRGVLLSIDDFGTGYSSLSYLKRFPVDNVKIDRSFVDGLDAPGGSEGSLVAAIIALARALDMSTVAEGVETDGQVRRLRQLGCERVQGYRFSRPVPADEAPGVVLRLASAAAPCLHETRDLAGHAAS
jgi:diguanylate cyclase